MCEVHHGQRRIFESLEGAMSGHIVSEEGIGVEEGTASGLGETLFELMNKLCEEEGGGKKKRRGRKRREADEMDAMMK